MHEVLFEFGEISPDETWFIYNEIHFFLISFFLYLSIYLSIFLYIYTHTNIQTSKSYIINIKKNSFKLIQVLHLRSLSSSFYFPPLITLPLYIPYIHFRKFSLVKLLIIIIITIMILTTTIRMSEEYLHLKRYSKKKDLSSLSCTPHLLFLLLLCYLTYNNKLLLKVVVVKKRERLREDEYINAPNITSLIFIFHHHHQMGITNHTYLWIIKKDGYSKKNPTPNLSSYFFQLLLVLLIILYL